MAALAALGIASAVAVANGGAGNDRIEGGSQSDRISGGSGNDTLIGDGRELRCPPGATSNSYCAIVTSTAPGSDTISDDNLSGGAGNDRISARDGRRDRINCGPGRDRVTADRRDAVSSNCERVSRR